MKKIVGVVVMAVLLIGGCDLFNTKAEDDLLDEIDAAVDYAAAPYANVTVGIIAGSLSATPTEAPREKVGYPFTVSAAAGAGFKFAGWRVLAKTAWEGLNQSDADFEAKFVAAANSPENVALASIANTLGVDGLPSGGASITALTASPLVIVPYAAMQPAISLSRSQPKMYDVDVNFRSQVQIRFDAPVTAESFMWQDGETPAFSGDLKNISISAMRANHTELASPAEIEALFKESYLSDNGDTLYLQLDMDKVDLTDFIFDQCTITISLGAEIERRGAAGVTIMPRQELIYTVTTKQGNVDTSLKSLEVSIGGSPVFPATGNPFRFDRNDYIIADFNNKDAAVAVTATELDAKATASVSAPTMLVEGKNIITVTVSGEGSTPTRYTVTINNYPAVDNTNPPTVLLTAGERVINASWSAVTGASGYYVYVNASPNFATVTNTYTTGTTFLNDIPATDGRMRYVWVQAYAGAAAEMRIESRDAGKNELISDMKSMKPLNSVITLASLTVDNNSFSGFSPANTTDTTYTLNREIANTGDAANVTVRFSKGDAGQKVNWALQRNGLTIASGTDVGSPIAITSANLAPGQNDLVITVTAEDGASMTNPYTILIYKRPAAPVLQAFTTADFNNADNQVTVHWASAISGAAGYEVYRNTATNSAGSTMVGSATVASVTNTLMSRFDMGSTYYIWVRSYVDGGPNGKVYSEYSNMITLSAVVTGSFTINGGSPISNTDYTYQTAFADSSVLTVAATPSSPFAPRPTITSADSGVSIPTTGNNSGDNTFSNSVTLNWGTGDAYTKTFTVTVKAQYEKYEQPYKVTVNRPSTVITSFKMETAGLTSYGLINSEATPPTIAITLPYGTSLTSLTPTVTASAGATVTTTGAKNFSSTQTYTVTSASGGSRDYTVTAQVASLASIAVTQPTTNTVYAVNSAVNTGIASPGTGITITGTDSAGNPISITTGCAYTYDFRQPGTKLVTVKHEASGLSGTYLVTVVGLTSLLIDDSPAAGFASATLTGYNKTIEPDIASASIRATTPLDGATLTIGGTTTGNGIAASRNVNVGANSIPVVVSYGTVNVTYAVTVNRKPERPVVTLAPSNQKITVNWGGITGVNGAANNGITFDVSNNTNGTEPGTGQAWGTDRTSGYAFSGATNNQRQYVWVRAKATNGTGTVIGDWSYTRSDWPGVADYTELTAAVSAGGDVYVTKDITMSGVFTVSSGTVTLLPVDTKSVKLLRGAGNTGVLFMVSGGTLNLGKSDMTGKSIALDGGAVWNDTNENGIAENTEITGGPASVSTPLVLVTGGSLNMYANSYVQNNINTSNGGGIQVQAGTFTMHGGTIQQNKSVRGGGVDLFDNIGNVTFTMSGGTITHNATTSTTSGGGGVYMRQSSYTTKFTMNSGAVISGNSGATGGGVLYNGAGTFTMNSGAAITKNYATTNGGGLFNSASTALAFSGTINDNTPNQTNWYDG